MAEPHFLYDKIDETMEVMINDCIPGHELLLYAEVYLEHGDRQEIDKVIGRKWNVDGNHIGHNHQNPILDSRAFIKEISDL
jgi:hypothetical protein